jgi:hypothetical protein
MMLLRTLVHYYVEFAHGNPGGFILLHIMAMMMVAVVIHEWILDGVHDFDPDTSLQIRDTSGNVTHLLCTHPHCHKWGRTDGRHG